MKVEQLYTKCLSESAYYVESNGEVAIIDPLRDINVYLKKCSDNSSNCSISKNNNDLAGNLNLSILKKAAKYEKEMLAKRRKENPYPMGQMKQGENRDDN